MYKKHASTIQRISASAEVCQDSKLISNYGYFPEEITTDGGFTSGDNYDYAVGKGNKKVLFTKKCTSWIAELVKTSQAYKRLKIFRAGIEGCISAAKRAYSF